MSVSAVEESALLLAGTASPNSKVVWYFSRWQSYSCACLFVSVAGTTYAYGIYSTLLKENLGFSQHGLDIVASVGNTGLYLSLLAGLALERYGLQVVVCVGGLLIFLGFLYIWAAVEGLVPANIFSICLFFFLSQFGVCCHVSSSVTYAVRLFPAESRGLSVGLVKGYFGLSSAVLGDFAGGYFANSPSSFLLFVALFVPTVGSVASQFANLLPQHAINFSSEERDSLAPFLTHWGTLFCVLLTIGLLQFNFTLPDYVNSLSASILVLALFFIVVLPGLYGPRVLKDTNTKSSSTSAAVKKSDGAEEEGEEEEDEEDDDSKVRQGEASKDMAAPCFYGESVPFLEAVSTWRFWSIYLIFLIMCGSGLMVIYNINAIASAAGKSPSTFFVSLISLANGLGRVLAGFISDIASGYLSKIELLSIVVLCMGVTQALLSIGSGTLLYPCLLSVGFLFGCSVVLTAISTASVYGGRHIATIFGAIDSAAIGGTVILATATIDIFYDEDTCAETKCFRFPFIINSVACIAAFILSSFLSYHTTPTRKESVH
jgi:MFS family permease